MLEKYVKTIPDHRRPQGLRYDLHGIIISVILACMSDGYSYRRIHSFIKIHFTKLRKLLNLSWKNPPSYRGLHAIISGISVTELEQAFRKYSTELYYSASKIFLRILRINILDQSTIKHIIIVILSNLK
jgi:hypothetical protein